MNTKKESDRNQRQNTPPKLLTWKALLRRRKEWRKEGFTVVWTNGCFDLFHAGHVRSLTTAKSFGDILVVGLNSDKSVTSLKGPSRPVLSQADRAEVLAALSCVDAVVIFNEKTPECSLKRLKPDVHCKGSDYAPPHGKPMPEARVVAEYGGRIAFLPMLDGVSTSYVIEKILSGRRQR
jgi:rfaE bifunctional protein nucleotidyltransferase chain/domain